MYFINIIIKLVLAYIITCILFGICSGIYFIKQNKTLLSNDESFEKYSKYLWFNCYLYLCGIIIMTFEFIISPYKFYKQFLNK